MIRSHNYRNTNPTCSNFESSFKTLLINNLTGKHSLGSNCEETDREALFSLQHFIENSLNTSNSSSRDTVEEIAQVNNISTLKEEECSAYNFQNIINKLENMQPFNSCNTCKGSISSQEIGLIIQRTCMICIHKISFICFRTKVRKHLRTVIQDEIDFSFFECTEHYSIFEAAFIEIIIQNFSISQWCSKVNKKLTGKDAIKSANIIELQAIHYFNYRLKNIRYI